MPEPALILEPPLLLQPQPPAWAERLVSRQNRVFESSGVRVTTADAFSLLTVIVERAQQMSASRLRDAVSEAYTNLGAALRTLEHRAIRLWNYMPDPGELLGVGLDRYMVFNDGRSEGYRHWRIPGNESGGRLPTATAVGVASSNLVVHCLASGAMSQPVENPRQIPAWRYSRRYGPTPPSFSRATLTVIERRQVLLVGGTASVVGEDTAHVGDIAAQVDETLENLTVLIASAGTGCDRAYSLDRLFDMRVYLTQPQDAAVVRETILERCRNLAAVEFVLAPLCRRDLLVEIEGVADLTLPR